MNGLNRLSAVEAATKLARREITAERLLRPCVTIAVAVEAPALPLGLQAVGRIGEDARTLAAAHWIGRRLAA